MKVLGIESSSLVASVALVTDDILTAEYTVNFKKTHSQTLLPMLDEIVKCWDWTWRLLMPLQQQGPGLLYRSSYWRSYCKRTGIGIKEASDPCTYSRCYCLQYVGASGLICPIMDAKGARYIQDCTTWKMELRRLWSSALWIWEN